MVHAVTSRCRGVVVCLALFLAAAVLGTAGRAQEPGPNLIRNGDFQTDADHDGWPDDWRKQSGVSVGKDNGNVWLVIDKAASQTQSIRLDPDWGVLRIACRMRLTEVEVGDEGWKDARLVMDFKDAAGKHVDPWPNVIRGVGTTDWIRTERDFRIPRGAVTLDIGPFMMGKAGKAEFDDISVTVTKLRGKKEDLAAPAAVTAPWDMATAWRQTSATRESICLNGLWAFRPLGEDAKDLPPAGEGWGWFKVPGLWPRGSSWDVGEATQEALLPDWTAERLDVNKFDQAWYRREFTVPDSWAGRRVLLDFTLVQTHAKVFIDGTEAGAVWFPGARLDVTERVQPGKTCALAVLVTARPIEKERQDFMANDRVVKSKAVVKFKGLTGDVFLTGEPKQDVLGDVHVITSTRRGTIAFDTAMTGMGAGQRRLTARVLKQGQTVREFASEPLDATRLTDGRFTFSGAWTDADLWDTDTPGNLYDAVVTLTDESGKTLDESLPVRFGFREFWTNGKDFYLNGRCIHLRALFTSSISNQADKVCFEGCRTTCTRLIEYGFNFLITSNYNFAPGEVSYMDGLFQATDATGMLASFSLPHFKDFAEDLLDSSETQARYRALCDTLIRRVQNHPSIILYAMNHNATGYYGDQNPLKIDGVYDPDALTDKLSYKGSPWRTVARKKGRLTARIAKALDPTRPVYHHQSGNLDDLHTVNCYLNWAPVQERSDWLEHWSTTGVKPLFFVEWGLPHISSWSSYRGPQFIWRCDAFQQVWDSEYAAAYKGEDAYRMTPLKVQSMAHEEKLWAAGKPFPWGGLIQFLRQQEENHMEIQALFAADNWRAHRTWGASAMLPWDQGSLWNQVRKAEARENPTRWEGLQAPGIVPDRLSSSGQHIWALEPDEFEPSSLGNAFLRWNMPLLAYIGGGPDRFTEKSHVFTPGETVRKQLVVVNDTRRHRDCTYSWTVTPLGASGSGTVTVEPGDKALVAVDASLPADVRLGEYTLRAEFDFGGEVLQADTFRFDIIAPVQPPAPVAARLALYDPKGGTAAVLDGLGVKYERVDAGADFAPYGALVIGREALTLDGPLPALNRVRDGLRVLIFEQTAAVLERRFGFRINVHGARRAFIRVPGHAVFDGLADELLRDWRGAATLVPPHLVAGHEVAEIEEHDPKWRWCGFENTRVWRCGTYGNVASVLIEKPERGGFLPLADCEFDLQYAPLLEYAEGQGRVIFCQLDVTGRTFEEPAARRLCANLLRYLDQARPAPVRTTHYAGDSRGAELLLRLGVEAGTCSGAVPAADSAVLVVGPAAQGLGDLGPAVEQGMRVLCLGLSGDELDRVLPGLVQTQAGPTVSALLEASSAPELAGISSADVHWRTRPTLAAVTSPVRDGDAGNAALRVVRKGKGVVVLCQAAPWMFDDPSKGYLRTTWRRNVFLVARLLANLGVPASAPLLDLFGRAPVTWDVPLPDKWVGRVDREDEGRTQEWFRPDLDETGWQPVKVPGMFDDQFAELNDYDGLFWYRVRFPTPNGMTAGKMVLHVGPADDESWVWLNGTFLGEHTKQTNPKDYWAFPREFEMTPGLLKPVGEQNVLVVRVNDTFQKGGLTGTPRLLTPAPWLNSFYLQVPIAEDDPYRYYRW